MPEYQAVMARSQERQENDTTRLFQWKCTDPSQFQAQTLQLAVHMLPPGTTARITAKLTLKEEHCCSHP